jgi:sugar phosphate isomerase/epimerase
MGAMDKTIIGIPGISSRTIAESAKFLVENINYSPSFLRPFYKKDFCNLCLDIGHLILGGESVKDILTDNLSVIREIHIHGVKGYEDHLCVSQSA